MKFNKNKKSYVVIGFLFCIMFLFQIQQTVADSYSGYDAGVGRIVSGSSQDDLVRGYKTKIFFSTETNTLSFLNLNFITAVNPDLDEYYNFLYLITYWRYYYIEYVKIEAKLSEVWKAPKEGIYEESFYPGTVFAGGPKKHSGDGSGDYSAEIKTLYDWIIKQGIGAIPWFGQIGSLIYTLTGGLPLQDTFTEGPTSNSYWWKYDYGILNDDAQTSLDIYVYLTQQIPKGYFSTYYSNFHRLYLTYTVGVRLRNIQTVFGQYSSIAVLDFTVSNTVVIQF
jgi:hypothetical protein